MDRRHFLLQGTTLGAALIAGSTRTARAVDPASLPDSHPADAKEAMARLVAGNRRFVAGKATDHPATPQALAELENDQHPFATILGCSDSRVPIELIFDQGLGDLFVIRLAGNVVDPDVQGSVEYAIDHLHTRLVVVLGHEGCGAVTAALSAEAEKQKEPPGVQQLLRKIQPALVKVEPSLPEKSRIHQAVEANVRLSIRELLRYANHREAYKNGVFDIVGAVYKMHTGKVEFLS